jgi:hypothetical protein
LDPSNRRISVIVHYVVKDISAVTPTTEVNAKNVEPSKIDPGKAEATPAPSAPESKPETKE